MKFIKENKYLTISIVLLIIFMPVSPWIGFFLAAATEFNDSTLYLISWIITFLCCMTPYIFSRMFSKNEVQKEKFERTAKMIGILLLVLFIFFAVG